MPRNPADRPATEPRPTTHTFEQVNWDNAEQETRIGALQEMVAILLNRLDEIEAASPAALDRHVGHALGVIPPAVLVCDTCEMEL